MTAETFDKELMIEACAGGGDVMMDELPAKCCGRCRFFRAGACEWNVGFAVPFYMRVEINMLRWSEVQPTSGNDCKAFKPRDKDSGDDQ